MRSVRYHTCVKDCTSPACWRDAPFARQEWFSLLEAHGHRPLVVVAGDGDDTLCLALQAEGKTLSSLANWYSFTWSPNGSTNLYNRVAADLRRKYDMVRLDRLPAEADIARLVADAFTGAGWQVSLSRTDTNYVLPCEGLSFAEYLAGRPGALRSTLKRKAAKLATRVAQMFDPQDWRVFEAIYKQSWKPPEGAPDLLRDFAVMEAEAGRYRLGIASLNEEPVAAQFWTVDGGTALIHKLAHRPGAASQSPGSVLTAAMMEHVLDQDRVKLVDFGTGTDPYKADWMDVLRDRLTLTCRNPSRPSQWPPIAKDQLRRLVRPRTLG